MKGMKRNNSRGLPIGAEIEVVDNSGAKLVKLISVKGYKTVKRKLECAGVGDLITAHVIKGKPDVKHTVVKCVVVRQKQEFRRPNGTTIKFEGNGAVVLKDEKSASPKGTLIKGAIAKEVGERFPAVARIATIIV
ncbi:uL14 family ribosomal protein [Candidatus Woesearchaeota archaeon]|nr:uL14 family ribosomal protein [Nanoarchaeota archaeon]MCB9369983.1 uL14 family ribosomal protein [Candidatus Woesearchaeota archaeon]USN44518.1 MAG: uL14 family ribosomal protein [Candidatus Woesearchaeota archaeon]